MLQRENQPNQTPADPIITTPLPELPDLLANPTVDGSACTADEEPVPNDTGANDDTEHDVCPWQQCCPDWTGPVLKIVDWRAVEAAFDKRSARADMIEQRRLSGLMHTLRSRGEYRKLMPIPPDWRAQLRQLEQDFPNFCEVTEYLRIMYALSEHRDRVVRFDPMLLNGDPGCGKSYFAECMAAMIGVDACTVHMETAQSNSVLSGSADYWSNTKSGQVFNHLVENDYANPCFIIDEVEKSTSRDYDPTLSLLGLLESRSARAFTDLSFPWLTLDASAVLWVCTSNNADLLPTPVLSRLRRFDIGPPTERETRAIVQRLFKQLLAELSPDYGTLRLSAQALEEMAGLAPRQLKRVLREAMGRALYDRRRTVLARDILIEQNDTALPAPIGFL